MRVWVEGRAGAAGRLVDLDGLPLLGHGGEAVVHDLGDQALKLYKAPNHPDVAGDRAREDAAAARLAAAEARLGSFPAGLPARIAAPRALVRDARKRAVVGYVMDRVGGLPLYELGEPRRRRAGGVELAPLVAALRELHGTVSALHAAGVIIGDFNDGNVLVDGVLAGGGASAGGGAGRAAAWLIDADSFAWGTWPCPMFTERFVDPRLCDRAAPTPVLVQPHDRDSDWFAYTAMLFRTLCWVGPYGGVHQPADPAARVAPAARALRGPSVLGADVVYPRAAAPLAILSDELLDHFAAVFDRGRRGPFPPALLDRLRLRRCGGCGLDHLRARCPGCARPVAVPATWGELTVVAVDPASVRWGATRLAAGDDGAAPMWLAGDLLWQRGRLGPEPVGPVVPGATWAWLGERTGAGLWRAGGYAVGFTFVAGRRGLDDRARLPAIRGRLLAGGCVPADDRAWLWWRELDGGRERTRVVVIGGGRVLAQADADDGAGGDGDEPPWMAGLPGACAAGPMLLVPTDGGVVRVEVDGGALVVTRRFPDTRPFVSAADDLAAVAGGLAVRKHGPPLQLGAAAARAVRLTFTTTRATRAGGST